MKKNYLILLSLLAVMFTASCTDTESDLGLEGPVSSNKGNVINQTSEVAGVRYTLKDLALNKEMAMLTSKDVSLLSNQKDIENGVYRLDILSAEATSKIIVGNSLYLRTDETTHLRKINGIEKISETSYVLTTEAGQLGDLFERGSIEFDVDVAKVQEIRQQKSMESDLSKTKVGVGINFDILDYVKEYKADGMTFNPNASVKALLHFKIRFDKILSILPMEFEVTYEIKPSINPYFNFDKAVNKKYNTDLLANLPDEIVQLLGKIEVDMDIPLGSSTLPAKVSIDQLNMPLNVFANISKEAKLGYGINGALKVGYVYYNPLLNKSSKFIYENTITTQQQLSAEVSGEVISDLYLVVTPKVTLLDISVFDVRGNISFGVEAITAAKINPGDSQYTLASKATAKAKGTFDAYLLGNKFMTTDILNESIDLWSIGTIDKSITLSNLRMVKPSKTTCKANSFNYAMTFDYKYFVNNKKVPGTINLTYDVYDDRNRLLKRGEKLTLTEPQLVNNQFAFNLCIPFRVDLLAITTGGLRPSSYIRNMTFTDSYGYTGSVPEFQVGSPYNNNFWK